MGKAKQREFQITARVAIDVDTIVRADSLEDALAQAKQLQLEDFVTIPGPSGVLDGGFRVHGVYEMQESPEA